VDGQAIFAGNDELATNAPAALDFFTEPGSGVAQLGGSVTEPANGSVEVRLQNSGTAALPANYSLAVYAATSRTLDSSAVLIGSIRVRKGLGIGASVTRFIPLTIPASLSAGQYILLAAAGVPGRLVQFTSLHGVFSVPLADVSQARETVIR